MSASIYYILPELTLFSCAILLLVGGVLGFRRQFLGVMAFIFIMLAIFILPLTLDMGNTFFSGMLVNSAFSCLMKWLILVITALVVLISIGYSWFESDDGGEYYFFVLSASVSMMFAVSAGNLMMLYLAVETLSIISYILASYLKKDLYSTEAGLKYFLFGALSTGLMLYGISLVYGLFGTLDFSGIGAFLATTRIHEPTLILTAVLIFSGLAFKASLVPFHMWVADVYEGAPWPVAVFFAVAPKATGFALLVNVFFASPYFLTSSWSGVAVLIAILTMTVGNLSAFHQNSVKRLLAFSSVAHAGYIFAAFAAGLTGLTAAFYYVIVYAFMNIGAFTCAAFLSSERAELESFKGMSRRAPVGAFLFSVFLLSLAGLPPLAGFFAKFFVLTALVDSGHLVLAAFLVVNSIVAFFYYLKIIKVMYFDETSTDPKIKIPLFVFITLIICLLTVVFLGAWPQSVIETLSIIFNF